MISSCKTSELLHVLENVTRASIDEALCGKWGELMNCGWAIPLILVLSQVLPNFIILPSASLPFSGFILANSAESSAVCYQDIYVCLIGKWYQNWHHILRHFRRVNTFSTFVELLLMASGKMWKMRRHPPFFFFLFSFFGGGNIYWRTHPTWRLYLDSFLRQAQETQWYPHPKAGRELRPLCVFIQYCTKSLSGSSHLMRLASFSFCFLIYTQFGCTMIIFPWEVCKTVLYLRRILFEKVDFCPFATSMKFYTTWYCEVVRQREEVVIRSDAPPARSL